MKRYNLDYVLKPLKSKLWTTIYYHFVLRLFEKQLHAIKGSYVYNLHNSLWNKQDLRR